MDSPFSPKNSLPPDPGESSEPRPAHDAPATLPATPSSGNSADSSAAEATPIAESSSSAVSPPGEQQPSPVPSPPPESLPREKSRRRFSMAFIASGMVVTIVATATGTGWLYGGGQGAPTFLPGVHLWLVHFPVAFLLAGFVLDWFGLFSRKLLDGVSLLVFLGSIASLTALASGFLIARQGGFLLETTLSHIAVSGLASFLAFAWWGALRLAGFGWREKLLSLLTLACLCAATWSGLALSHPDTALAPTPAPANSSSPQDPAPQPL